MFVNILKITRIHLISNEPLCPLAPGLGLRIVENQLAVTAETLAEVAHALVRRRCKCLVHVNELKQKNIQNQSLLKKNENTPVRIMKPITSSLICTLM